MLFSTSTFRARYKLLLKILEKCGLWHVSTLEKCRKVYIFAMEKCNRYAEEKDN